MRKVKLFTIAVYFFAALAAILAWSCSEDDAAEGYGKLRVSLTDAPFAFNLIEEANVGISKIELRHKDSVSGSPYVVVFEDSSHQVNLVDLRNGIVEELASVEVPAGEYDLVRVYIDEASVKLMNGSTYELKVPSGLQSGLKIFVKPGIAVQGGLTSELLLDFDLHQSFVVKGNPGDISGFNFKPVIRAVNNSEAGRVEGYVLDSAGASLNAAYVWLENDTTVSSTLSDSSGFFALIGIPEGSYRLLCTKEGYDTAIVEEVSIVAANRNEIDLQLTKNQE